MTYRTDSTSSRDPLLDPTTTPEPASATRPRSLPIVLILDDNLRWRRRVARALHSRAIVRTASTV